MKQLSAIISLLLLSFSLKATHNRSGEILYVRIAPFSTVIAGNTVALYTYSFTIIKYTDDGPGIADRCSDTLYFGDGTKAICARINGSLTGCCTGNIPCGELIVNTLNFKIKKNVYSAVHTYPGPGVYIASSTDANRTPGAVNYPNSGNVAFYLECKIIINSATANNASPVLTYPPKDQGYTYQCFYHNPTAIDADGDSLSYDLLACNAQANIMIPGYTFPATGPGGYFFINPTTGLLHWCSPQQQGFYSFAIRITEWRKNSNQVYQQLGYVIRDMQVFVNSQPLGLSDTDESPETPVIFPNPVSDKLNLVFESLNSPGKISIYALDGRLMMQAEIPTEHNKMELSTSNLAKGSYILYIQEGANLTRKVIIKE